ncbi:hypothetical protein Patl1_30271 [Pistacia atlantica]|uniref:Uncharacterized protein n=1 Tax=Pistacia atlantica TaxID=434234 RepID=A0ACC1A9X3_9ROSI|nr:hypothetical protein Patl1_30271 [Pistacia atlantica]
MPPPVLVHLRSSRLMKIHLSGKTTTFRFVLSIILKYQHKGTASVLGKRVVRQLLGRGIPSHVLLLTLLPMRMSARRSCSKWLACPGWRIAWQVTTVACLLMANLVLFLQTGSGKTHTMLVDIEGGTQRHSVNCGMTPRVFEHSFFRIQKIREDIKKGVHVENLKEIEVTSAWEGAANRKVAATNMNRASNRSHSVFTCVIESKWESQGVTHQWFAWLVLVDLAGFERQKSSGAEGEHLKEATNINKLAIMNLVNVSNGKSLHVPYRDCLHFCFSCSLETLSTLKFAQCAKFINNNAVNEDALGDVISMRLQIQQLKKKDYELALGGAFKREKEKDKALQALASENQAAIRLVCPREMPYLF